MISIAIASDHRGFQLKARLIQSLAEHGFEAQDAGTEDDQACDYPDYGCRVAEMVSTGQIDRGILICGTGIGMSIVANKYPGVRAASAHDEVMVEISRRHNDVNILCLPGDLIGSRDIGEIVLMWLQTEFDGGRHAARIEKIRLLENERLGDQTNSPDSKDQSGP